MTTSFTYFGGKEDERIPMEVERLTIDPSVQDLPAECCKKRLRLKQVTFTESSEAEGGGLKTIGRNAFRSCPALETITLPSTVQVIQGYAFGFCSALMEVHFPGGLKRIERRAFFTCSALQTVKIPSSLEMIESYTFHSCSALTEVDMSNALLTRIGSYAFHSCSSLESIKVPKTVEIIDEYAFLRCRSLANVDLCEGLKVLGPGAFSGCRSLSSIKIPSTVKVIRVHTFFECKSLKEIEIQEGTVELGEHAFEKCTSLKAMALTKSIQSIGFCAFNRCESLISIELPAPPTAATATTLADDELWIQEGAFHECHSLANICLPRPPKNYNEQDQQSSSSSSKIHYTCFDECHLLQEEYGVENTVLGLSSRFNAYPVHKLCYYASSTTPEALKQQMKAMDWNQENRQIEQQAYQQDLTDPFGMTPFHILFSAAKCRKDLLQILLEECLVNMLDWKDKSGNLATDFLGCIWTESWRSMFQMVLQKWMVDSISSWGLERWRHDMTARVNAIYEVDDRAERE
ncbi:unnamed protein product [Cylindrotheca closterium]|uniref:Uncharacterized protein n=1 Tax=Cylindrotheca closterium TaxID=2856 RepID=A0AAD2G3E0_9STRA|nr:unnamed protein product [Cylindrotheca closterium]